jgi:uncharacterized glyoxalase superfamily protein PhnB
MNCKPEDKYMDISHVHFCVRDLTAAVRWFNDIFQKQPSFSNDRIATLVFGDFTVILDASRQDSCATLGFNSSDCDLDYRSLLERGAVSVAAPQDQPWGARSAYVKGPGALIIEFEQMAPQK